MADSSKSSNRLVFLLFGGLVALLIASGIAAYIFAPRASPAQTVVMNGYDQASGTTIDPINVWDDYATRQTVVARVHDGARVTMLRRSGDGVLIRTRDGVEGWVTYWFIKGLTK